MFEENLQRLRDALESAHIELGIITDDDSIYYFTGYYDFLHMEFGRPTLLLVSPHEPTTLITPAIDHNTALAHARVDRIEAWNDGVGEEWRGPLAVRVTSHTQIAIEHASTPSVVRDYLQSLHHGDMPDLRPLIAKQRMIKSTWELQLARHAGEVAQAMMSAGRNNIAHGVPEYEVALAISAAGTRKAAQLLREHYDDQEMSPNTHFLQIMASGETVTKTHHRASSRVMQKGEPVFLCFCGMTNFHRFKLGFDRTFWIEHMADTGQQNIYEIAVASQAAALRKISAGVLAEDVHAEYAEVIQSAGYDFPFRCGRGTGFSYLESPQLVAGDKTRLLPGMVLAVDGSVTTDRFRAQVGDSVVVTETGYEPLTAFAKDVEDVVIGATPV